MINKNDKVNLIEMKTFDEIIRINAYIECDQLSMYGVIDSNQ